MMRRMFIKVVLFSAASFTFFKLFLEKGFLLEEPSPQDLSRSFKDLSRVLLEEKREPSSLDTFWNRLSQKIPGNYSLKKALASYPLTASHDKKLQFVTENKTLCQNILILLYTGESSFFGVKLDDKTYLLAHTWPLIRPVPVGLPAGKNWNKEYL